MEDISIDGAHYTGVADTLQWSHTSSYKRMHARDCFDSSTQSDVARDSPQRVERKTGSHITRIAASSCVFCSLAISSASSYRCCLGHAKDSSDLHDTHSFTGEF